MDTTGNASYIDNLSIDELKLLVKRTYYNNNDKLNKSLRNKQWYNDNKNYHKSYYDNNKDYIKARNRYRYYNKKGEVDTFINKYNDDYLLLLGKGFFKDT